MRASHLRGAPAPSARPTRPAHVVVSKCADAMPRHHLAQQMERGGVPVNRSTRTDLFHQSAQVLRPLPSHLLNPPASLFAVETT
ncbi:IS66 family transposase [Myxococcus sp. MISCRS1]|uniref:IS66 family transposase n=1 Tax=Myxococcus sp. MISCRS1 TaxID=2996786 RepID=UPI003B637AA7